MGPFRELTGNVMFRPTAMTWFSLITLLILYPTMQLIGGGEDTLQLLESMNQGMVMFTLAVTVVFLWMLFGILYASVYTEKTGLIGLGLGRLRLTDFAWAGAFFAAAMAILSGVAAGLAEIGLPMPGEIGILIPTSTEGKLLWVVVSFTAGFCEEIAFRGYLMTRLRLVGKFRSWIIPTVVSAVVFGACHAYQGWPGFILITIYGALFSLLYIRTGRLWPCIIAHFLQDFSNLFIPH